MANLWERDAFTRSLCVCPILLPAPPLYIEQNSNNKLLQIDVCTCDDVLIPLHTIKPFTVW